jgi:hypothetical protein
MLKFFVAYPDLDPGSGMEKLGSGIRDKHPGFATKPQLKQLFLRFIPYGTGYLLL